jgi:spore protease
MIVTPKNVDAAIERLARVIADALNMTLHSGVSVNEINEFFI